MHGTDVAIEDIGGEPRHAAIFATPPRRRVARIAGGVAAVAEPDPDATRAGGRGWGPDPPSPAAYLGGGALLGGIVGAASAYVRGRPVGPAAIEGAFAGGIGGAVVGEVVRVDGGNSPGGRGGGGGTAWWERIGCGYGDRYGYSVYKTHPLIHYPLIHYPYLQAL